MNSNMKRLLDVLTVPQNNLLPPNKICELANCQLSDYYAALTDADFIQEYRKRVVIPIYQHAGNILSAMIEKAERGSVNHAKLLLQIIGLVDLPKNINIVQNNLGIPTLTPEETEALMRELVASRTNRTFKEANHRLSLLRGEPPEDTRQEFADNTPETKQDATLPG